MHGVIQLKEVEAKQSGGTHMSKLKIGIGVSRVERTKLQVSVDQTIAKDIELLAEWSNNDKNYIINELLRFALDQAEEFQKYKARLAASTPENDSHTKSAALPSKPDSEKVLKSPHTTSTAGSTN